MTNVIVGKSRKHEVASKRINLMENLVVEIRDHEDRLTALEDTMRINGIQELKINKAGKNSVLKELGGKKSNAYKKLARKTFSKMWNDFKNHFEIPRYGELPAKQFEEGLKFASEWYAPIELKSEIDEANRQTELIK